MIPLRLEKKLRRLPFFTWLLLAANIAVFVQQLLMGDRLPGFIEEFALIPARLLAGANPEHYPYAYPYRTLVTSIFLHGGLLHLLGNMITLWVFGPLVEDRMGHPRYLLFFLTGGVVAGVGHVVFQAHSTVPCVGASGAIAAVLGASLIISPRARVLTFAPIFIFWRITRMPAFLFLLIWFAMQIWLAHSATTGETNIAVMAHIVGFVYGLVAAALVGRG